MEMHQSQATTYTKLLLVSHSKSKPLPDEDQQWGNDTTRSDNETYYTSNKQINHDDLYNMQK